MVLGVVVLWRRLDVPRDRRTWGHLAVAALIGNALPYTLFGIAEQTVGSNVSWRADAVGALLVLGDVGSTKASTVIYLLPLVAIGLGWLVLREPVSSLAGAGAVLIVAGIYLVRQREHRSI